MKLVPLARGSKAPDCKKGQDWHDLITDDPVEIDRWKERGLNLGLPLFENQRSVIDFDGTDTIDGREAARDFYRRHKPLCTVITESRRGIHFHFSGETKTRKFELGDIKGNGYVVYPESVVSDFRYRLIELGELQPFPEHLFPIEQKQTATRKEIRNVAAYIKKIHSIQGENGSAALIRTIARCRDNGLTEAEATILILEWNETNAVPPWPHDQLARAISRTFAKGG